MNRNRLQLMDAMRTALFQRSKVQRSARTAQANFAPQALQQRAQDNATRQIDEATIIAGAVLRDYAVPLGLAATAGIAFVFRRPLLTAADAVAGRLRGANAPSPPSPTPEHMMSQFDDMLSSSRETAAAAKARIEAGYGRAKAVTSEAAAKGRDEAAKLVEKVAPIVARSKDGAAKAGNTLKSMAEQQPLTLIAGAVAVGALLGTVLPRRHPPTD